MSVPIQTAPRPAVRGARYPSCANPILVSLPSQKARDPRFDSLSGSFNPALFSNSYNFLNDAAQKELQTMRETAKKARKSQILPEEDKEEIEAALRRMESKELARKNKEREARALKEWKKEEEKKRGEGKKEFFLKKGELRRVEVGKWRRWRGADWRFHSGSQRRRSRLCSRQSSTSYRRTRRRSARRSSANGKRRARRRRSSFQTGAERYIGQSKFRLLHSTTVLFSLLACNSCFLSRTRRCLPSRTDLPQVWVLRWGSPRAGSAAARQRSLPRAITRKRIGLS